MTRIALVCDHCGEYLVHCPWCDGTGCTLLTCRLNKYCNWSQRSDATQRHAPRCPHCSDQQWWCSNCDP